MIYRTYVIVYCSTRTKQTQDRYRLSMMPLFVSNMLIECRAGRQKHNTETITICRADKIKQNGSLPSHAILKNEKQPRTSNVTTTRWTKNKSLLQRAHVWSYRSDRLSRFWLIFPTILVWQMTLVYIKCAICIENNLIH